MQYHWLNKRDGNKKLLLFFCGWSFDYKPFERLACNDYDVLMLYDYNDLSIPIEILGYEEYFLITWSMGVFVAYLLKEKLPEFKEKIAINGTPFPVDNEKGIPIKTFDLTLKYVDTGLQGKFQRNLFKTEEDFQKYLQSPVAREIPNQASELVSLKKLIDKTDVDYKKYYNRAIISNTDKIIPTRNQHNCWDNVCPVVVLNSGHFPFYDFESWNDILKCR